LLEFDEAYHQEPANHQADQRRDDCIEQQTGLRPLRIRHEEQAQWVTACQAQGRILSFEEYLQGLLEKMEWQREGRHIDITCDSAQSAYTCDPAGYLHYPAQPRRDLKRIAKRLGWGLIPSKPKHSGSQSYNRITAPLPTAR